MRHIVETCGFTLRIWFLTALFLKVTNNRENASLDIPFSSFLGDLSLFCSFNLSFLHP